MIRYLVLAILVAAQIAHGQNRAVLNLSTNLELQGGSVGFFDTNRSRLSNALATSYAPAGVSNRVAAVESQATALAAAVDLRLLISDFETFTDSLPSIYQPLSANLTLWADQIPASFALQSHLGSVSNHSVNVSNLVYVLTAGQVTLSNGVATLSNSLGTMALESTNNWIRGVAQGVGTTTATNNGVITVNATGSGNSLAWSYVRVTNQYLKSTTNWVYLTNMVCTITNSSPSKSVKVSVTPLFGGSGAPAVWRLMCVANGVTNECWPNVQVPPGLTSQLVVYNNNQDTSFGYTHTFIHTPGTNQPTYFVEWRSGINSLFVAFNRSVSGSTNTAYSHLAASNILLEELP